MFGLCKDEVLELVKGTFLEGKPVIPVSATNSDGETLITAKNLDLLATENFAEIYNDVYLDHGSGNLEADRINYNFETKNFKVSMFGNKKIKMKVVR